MHRVLIIGLCLASGCITREAPDDPPSSPQPAVEAPDIRPAPASPPEAESPAPETPADAPAEPPAEVMPEESPADPPDDPVEEPAPAPWAPEQLAVRSDEAVPLDILCLDARDFAPADIVAQPRWRFLWNVLEQPRGSTARFAERFLDEGRATDTAIPDDRATPEACLFLDLAGGWSVGLDMVDAATPNEPMRVARLMVEVRPDTAIHVQLVWDTPLDPDQADQEGTDVDLHVRHPNGDAWSEPPWDCHYANAAPDWGSPGPDGNPSLDIDDVNGAGPENIGLHDPEDTLLLPGNYAVGAHYYRADRFDGPGWGSSVATVRIFLHGVLAFEADQRLENTGDFWRVAEIEWIDGVGRVIPIGVVDEAPPPMPGEPDAPPEAP